LSIKHCSYAASPGFAGPHTSSAPLGDVTADAVLAADGSDAADGSLGSDAAEGFDAALGEEEPDPACAIDRVVRAGTVYAVAANRPRRPRALRRDTMVLSSISFAIFSFLIVIKNHSFTSQNQKYRIMLFNFLTKDVSEMSGSIKHLFARQISAYKGRTCVVSGVTRSCGVICNILVQVHAIPSELVAIPFGKRQSSPNFACLHGYAGWRKTSDSHVLDFIRRSDRPYLPR
jgi:hypothetical protein